MTDRPGPPRFRPRGSLAPSAASWLDRASGGPGRSRSLEAHVSTAPSGLRLPSELSLRVGRAPLVGVAGSLAVRPGRSTVRRARSCHPRFHATRPTFGRRASPDPPRARGSLSATPCGAASRSPWTSHAGLTTSRPLRRLRSVPPHRESVHVALDGHPVARAVGALLGVPAPPEPCSRRDLEPSPFTRHRGAVAPRVTRVRLSAHVATIGTTTRAPLVAHATSAFTGDPRRRVDPHEDDRNVPCGPSADTGSITTRAVPWSSLLGFLALREAAALTPMTSDVASGSSRLASRARSTVARGHG